MEPNISKRAQGAFEYILLLAGILLIVVVVITVLRVSVIPAANQTLQAGLQQWQQAVTSSVAAFDGCSFNLCDGVTIDLGKPANGEVVVSVSSPDCLPGVVVCLFNSSVDLPGNMSLLQGNYRVFVNVSRKYGVRIDASGSHAVNITSAGTPIFSSSVVPPADATPPGYYARTSFIAGNITPGYAEGVGSNAIFNTPRDIAISGNYLYVADTDNNRIRRVDLATNATSLVAGNGTSGYAEGVGSNAMFYRPYSVAVSGNYLYVLDKGNNLIRKIDLTTNATSLVAGNLTPGYLEGVGSNARFAGPRGITVSGNYLYVADSDNNRIRRIDLTTNATSLVVGNGTAGYLEGIGSNAVIRWPYQVAVSGNYLYFVDTDNNRIRRVDLTTNATSLVAGNGTAGYAEGVGSNTMFYTPLGLAASGNYLYVADTLNNRIRKIDLTTNTTSSVVGNGTGGYLEGVGSNAMLYSPRGIAVSGDYLYFTDTDNHLIRKIS
jgi:hypothetical protein